MFLTKHVKTVPLFWIDNPDLIAAFRAKGWVEASTDQVADYNRHTPYTDGLPYPAPYIEPADQDKGPGSA